MNLRFIVALTNLCMSCPDPDSSDSGLRRPSLNSSGFRPGRVNDGVVGVALLRTDQKGTSSSRVC
jgi:hypothetical protein